MSDNINDVWGSVQIPYSQESEEAVLGAVQLAPHIFPDLALFLKAEHFYILRHKYMWEAMARIAGRKEPIDYITITKELGALGTLAEVGGLSYVSHLANACPSSSNAEIYARLVEATATRRRLMMASDHIKGLALNETITIDTVLDESQAKLDDVKEGRIVENTLVPISVGVNTVWDNVNRMRENPDALAGLSTGYPLLDDTTDGLTEGEIIVVGGRSSMGKTTLVLNVGYKVAKFIQELKIKTGIDLGAVAIFTMEMNTEQVVAKLLAMDTQINSRVISRGKFGPLENPNKSLLDAFTAGAGRVGTLPIFIDPMAGQTPRGIIAQCRKIKRECGLALIIVDGLWLMKDDMDWGKDRRLELSSISTQMKDWTHLTRSRLLITHQLSRSVEGRQEKRPVLSDLAESGTVENDADQVWMLYRDEYYNPGVATPGATEVNVIKHRNGDTGTVDFHFDKRSSLFFESAAVNMNQP